MITKPQKYTREFVIGELDDMLKEILENPEIVFIGELFEHRDYSRQRYSEWAKDFSDDTRISDTIKRITDILESRINIGGLKNKLNPTMTIFNLKNNYGWKDKTETELSNPDGTLNPYNALTADELRKLASK